MLGSKIAYNSLVSAGARIIGLALSLITIGFITRYLGQEGFGYYTTILAFLYFFTTLADLGLYATCVRDISKIQADEEKIVSNAFTIRFLVGLVIFVFAPLLAYFLNYPAEVKWGILIGGLGFWMMSNQQVLLGVFQKYLRVDKVALAEFLGRLTQMGLVAFFIWQGFNFFYIVGAIVGGGLVNFLLVFYFARTYVRVSFAFDFLFWKKLLKKSLPLALAIIFTAVYFKIDTIMLSLMKPAAHVGIYGLAYKILESLLFFPAMFIGLVMPIMSKYAFINKNKFKQIIQESLNLLLLFIVPMVMGTFFISLPVVKIIAGDDFTASAGVLNILIVATGIIFLGVLFSNAIIALEKQKSLTYIYGFGVAVNLIANFIFIPKYSYHGAALTTLLTEFLVTALMIFVIYRYYHLLFSFKPMLKYLLAALVMGLTLYVLASWSMIFSIIAGGLIYFIILWLLGEVHLGKIKKMFFRSYV